ncbi:MAG: hypothetical protein ACKOVB_03280 [Terrabacter sp.]
MKWWLVLVAFVLGVVVTWLLTARRDSASVPTSGTAVSGRERPAEGEADDASAFGGAPSEFSSEPGEAERWHRDWEDEDALMAREPVAGVGEPEAVRAVDAVEIEDVAHDATPTGPGGKPEPGAFTGDAEPAAGDEEPDERTPRA